jgi:two-component system LytT family response regulator
MTMRVLIVDDDATNGSRLRAQLEAHPEITSARHVRADEASTAELDAADYLVMRVGDRRLREAAQRLLSRTDESTVRTFRRTILVKITDRLIPLDVADIDCILASGPYADILARGRRYTIRASLSSLQTELDPNEFMRVHRSAIVRLRAIASFKRLPAGDGALQTQGGTSLRVSRARRAALERWFG